MSPEPRVYAVRFADGITEELSLTPLGSGTYRLEESALIHDPINLGDIIAAESICEDEIEFVGVSQKSPYETLRWLIAKNLTESEGLPRFLERVVEAGGLWERALGGLLILHIPRSSAFDAEREFKLQMGN
jgi:Domain of unknown function (DUF4265)